MNDLRNINYVAIAKNCTRTNGSDTIGAVAVTGVQLWSPKTDAGAAATTYIGPGEVLITDNSGKALTTATALKSVESITIHTRGFEGNKSFNRSKEIRGKDIQNYFLRPYEAPVECFAGVTAIDATKLDFSYQLTVQLKPSNARVDYELPKEATVTFRSAVGGSTAAQIYAGLAAELNAYFGETKGEDFQLLATPVATGIHIVALENPWDIDSFRFHQTRFEVVLNVDATIVSNLAAPVTFLTVPYAKATRGAGHYKLVCEAQADAQAFLGQNRDQEYSSRYRKFTPLSVPEFETDGTTPIRYDELVLNWEYTNNHTLTGTDQRGHVSIFLPVEDNATSQVGVATVGIVPIMDKFVATEFEVGSAQIGNITTP